MVGPDSDPRMPVQLRDFIFHPSPEQYENPIRKQIRRMRLQYIFRPRLAKQAVQGLRRGSVPQPRPPARVRPHCEPRPQLEIMNNPEGKAPPGMDIDHLKSIHYALCEVFRLFIGVLCLEEGQNYAKMQQRDWRAPPPYKAGGGGLRWWEMPRIEDVQDMTRRQKGLAEGCAGEGIQPTAL
eukprot:gene4966-2648_t